MADPEVLGDATVGTTRRREALAFGWAARLGAELATAGLAFFTGALVAQHLGPAGKGEVSTLGYLVAIVTTVGALGLGEAAATMHGLQGTPMRRALRASIPVLVGSSIVAVVITSAAAKLQLSGAHANTVTVIAVCLPVPAMIFARALFAFLDAERRVVVSSALRLLMAAATAASTWLFVIALDRGVAGALVAPFAGSAVGALIAAVVLKRLGGSFRPQFDGVYVRQAIRYGSPLMTSVVMLVLAGRADIFLVRALTDNRDTGLYSVALTLSQLASYPADSLLAVAYPRLARLPSDRVLPYILRITRAGIAAALLTAIAVAVVTPVAVPVIFGRDFRSSVGPTLILLTSVVLYGAQSLLTRARAARGQPSLAVYSFGASLVSMLLLDIVLIPTFDIQGAALASLISVAVGLLVCIIGYRREHGGEFRLDDLVPRARDLTELWRLVRNMARTETREDEVTRPRALE